MTRKKKILSMMTVALIAFAFMFGIGTKKVYADSNYYRIKVELDGKGTASLYKWGDYELGNLVSFEEPNVLLVDKAAYDADVAGAYPDWTFGEVLSYIKITPNKGFEVGSYLNDGHAFFLKDSSNITNWEEYDREREAAHHSKLQEVVDKNNEVTVYPAWQEQMDTISLKVEAPLCGEQVTSDTVPKISFPKTSHCSLGSYLHFPDYPPMWIKRDEEDPYSTEPYNGTYKAGDKAYAAVQFMQDYGYFINPDIEEKDITVTYTDWQGKEVKGKTAYIQCILTPGYEADANYIVVEVEAQHVPGPTVIENQVKPTKTSDGSHDEVIYCKKCNAELMRKTVPHKIGVLLAKFKTKGKNKLILSWNKLPYVEGYDIFFAKCNKKDKKRQCKLKRSIKGNNTFKWNKKNLKKNTPYKAYVAAWVMINGKKTYIRESLTVHSFTGEYDKDYTNPKSLSVNKNTVSLKKGGKFSIVTTIKKVNKKRQLISKNHTRALRYISTDPKIATVDKSGNILGKGLGTCTVHVVTVNGIRKDIQVTVE